MARRGLELIMTVAIAAALLLVPEAALAQSAAPDAVPGELIVRFKSSVKESQREDVRERAGAELEERLLPAKGLELVDLDSGVSLVTAERSFERQSGVLYAEPNFYRRAAATGDPMSGSLWGLNNTGQSVNAVAGTADADIDAPEAWELTTGSPSVTVAVLDTGVAYDHADLAANIWTNAGESGGGKESNGVDDDSNGKVDDVRGWDFAGSDNDPRDGDGHGTHVAGTIGARGDDGYGVRGVAWDAKLMPVKVLGDDGRGSVADVIAGYAYAAQKGATVVNASLGGSSYTQAERDAIEAAPGTLFVVAAGNDKHNVEATPQYPCNYSLANLICVAASDSRDQLASSFSNYGSTSVDLAAPGTSTLSSYARCADAAFPYWHAYLSGTSMATPHVAGAAALVRSRYRTASVAQVRERLLSSVDTKPTLAGKTVTGGRLNAYAALTYLSPATVEVPTGPETRNALQPIAEPGCVGTSAPATPVTEPAPPVTVPTPPSPLAAATDVTSPRISVAPVRGQGLRRVLSGGLKSVVRCSEACSISTRALVDRRTAKRLRLTPVLGRASVRLSASGGRTVAVKLSRSARRRLARTRSVALTLRARGVDRAGNARTVTARMTLRR